MTERMMHFQNLMSSLLPDRIADKVIYVGESIRYPLDADRVLKVTLGTAPGVTGCWGISDCLWLKIIGKNVGEIDMCSFPFKDYFGKTVRIDEDSMCWDFGYSPDTLKLSEFKASIESYLRAFA